MADRGDIRAGRAFVELLLRDKKFVQGLGRAVKRLASFAKAAAVAGAAVAAAGVVAGVAALKRFAAFGDEVGKMAKRTGIGTQALAELGFAAEQSGTDLNTVEKSVRRMQKTIGDAHRGLSTATDAFETLGLKVTDLDGLSPEQQFDTIAKKIAEIEDPTKRASAAMEIFGSRTGTAILPMLEDMAALRQEARELGLTLTDDQVAAAEAVTDAFNRIKRVFNATVVQIGAALAPAFLDLADRFIAFTKVIREFVTNNPLAQAFSAGEWGLLADLAITSVKVAILSGLESINNISGGMLDRFVNGMLNAFGMVQFAVNNWKLLFQIALVSAGVSILAFGGEVAHTFTERIPTLLRFFWDNWRDIFTTVLNFTKAVAENIWKNLLSLWEGIKSLFSGEGFTFEWTNLTDGFESAIKELPKIAAREMGPLEKEMRDRLADLTDQLGGKFEAHQAGRKEFGISQELRDANERLVELAARAKAARDAAAKGVADEAKQAGDAAAGGSGAGKSIIGSFSAAALAAQGQGGGSPQQKMVKSLDEIRKLARQQYLEQKKMRKELAGSAIIS